MGNIGPMEILLIALVALLLFGAGRIADIGKGLGQGIKNFKQGLKEAEELDGDKKPADKQLPPAGTTAVTATVKEDGGAKA
jgi:sec-independent protein translocase protein TatA